MKKLSVLIIFLLALSMSAFAGNEKKAEGDGKVTIEFWHLDQIEEHAAVWANYAKQFEEMHPNVTINITVLENETFKNKIATVMQSGNPPDIFRSWGGGVMNSYAEAGLLKDITADVKKWPTEIGKGAIDVYSYKGKTYGLPYDMGAVGFWYNKKMFADVGYNEPPKTWKDLLDLVKKLKAAGITPISLGEGDKWPGHFWWVYLAVRIGGKEAFDAAYQRTGSFKDETFVKAGVMLKELIDMKPFQEGFLGSNYTEQATLMANGKTAMELMGQWAPDVQKGNALDGQGLGDNLGFFPFPAVEGGKGKLTDAMGGGNGYIIGRDATPETIEFLKYLTSLEVAKDMAKSPLGTLPTVKGAEVVLDNPYKKIIIKMVSQAGYYQLYYDQYLPPAVGEMVKDATQGLFAGSMTPEQAAAAIDDAFVAEL